MIQRSCIAEGWKDNHSPNLQDTSARVCVQLVFIPRRRYGLIVEVWWYIFNTLSLELFVSQGLIQAETTASRKASTWSKGNKDGRKK